jgi:hypothetical protein
MTNCAGSEQLGLTLLARSPGREDGFEISEREAADGSDVDALVAAKDDGRLLGTFSSQRLEIAHAAASALQVDETAQLTHQERVKRVPTLPQHLGRRDEQDTAFAA